MKKIYETIRTAVNGNFRSSPNTRRKLVIGSVFLLAFLFAGTRASADSVSIVTNFTTPGPTNWSCPPGVTSVVVECWGGGGAGGSAQLTGGSTPQYGGGGAGGAYARYNLYAVVPGRTYYINVGAGGYNNFMENDVRVSGGDSWFTNNLSSNRVIAKGGGGGESAIGSTTATGYGLSGAGTAAGSTGDVVYAGGSGATGAANSAGGGGSSAGTSSDGVTAISNAGATAPAGGGNGGTGPTISDAAGGGGVAPGGGGSGGRSSSGFLKAGGRGGAGAVTLTYVSNIVPIVNLSAPTNGQGFFTPVSIELTAEASDADGVITTVGFYKDNSLTPIGLDTESPYTYTWVNVQAGSYSLTARATDNFGAISTSAVAVITVANPTNTLTVNSGSGSGWYTNGQQVAISADVLSGKRFDRWIGDTQVVNNVTYTNALVNMSTNPATLTATYKNIYTLTVNSGSGSGSYTNGHVQNIVASNAPNALMLFDKWTGASQYVANITAPNTTATIPTNDITLTATYKNLPGYYTLTVSNGTGGGTYSDGVQVPITANPPAAGNFFVRWIGDTQYVNNATYTNALVTISANNVNLTATYTNFTYALTVNSGTGGGLYTNGARVTITATNVPGKAFDQWIGDTQVVAGVFSLSSIVTMSTNPVVLTATFKDASNGVVNVNWAASGGFYFSADPGTGILGPNGSGKSTIAQLMYSPDNNKDNIRPNRAGAVNDVVWDIIPLTENGDGIIEWGSFVDSTVRAFTNGYVYALIFQDDNTQPGDWYYSTPLVAITTNAAPQSIEMNTDTLNGDPIDGTNGAQVIEGILLTVNSGTGGGWYTNGVKVNISANTPAAGSTFRAWTGDANVLSSNTASTTVNMSTNPVTLTAAYYYTLTVDFGSGTGSSYTNGAKVPITSDAPEAGKTFNQWIGIGAQYVVNVYNPNTTVTMPTQSIAVRATFKDSTYNLTVNSGSGSGLYASGTQVAIAPSDLRAGVTFKEWAGDTQVVNNVTYTNALVTMPTNPATLSAMYYYDLTVNSGSGDESYTNGAQVGIAADDPVTGKTFDQWTGDTQVVDDVTYTNALVTMSTNPVTLSATYKNLPGWYTLTVNSGDGDGPYTNTQVVAITADAPAPGKTFYRWTGDTQYMNNVTYTNALVTMPTNAVTLTATYADIYYTLTVNSGGGDGSYTNTQVVAISADAPASGMAFDQWIGDTQVVANISSASTTVTMPTNAVSLTATYAVATYMLTVNNGSGSGSYTNGALVPITAIAPEGTAFVQWTGDTQAVASVVSLNTTVTMSTNAVTLTAACVDASNGVMSVAWSSFGFYFSTDSNVGILAPLTSGKSTIAQLMYSPDDVKDDILPSGAGAVNDVVLDTVVITENSTNEWATFNASTVRAWTNGYVYGLIFQDDNVGPGDWYFFSTNTPLLALEKKQVGDEPQNIRMTTDEDYGDPIDFGPNNAQVIDGIVLTVNSGTGSGTYTNEQQVAILANAPASGTVFDKWTGATQHVNNVTNTNALVTIPASNITVTATYKNLPGFYTLTVNSGTGDGSYTNTQVVAISADAPASGQGFYRWTGNTAYVANSNSASTTVTMPAQTVSLTATYTNIYTLTGNAGANGTVSPTNVIVLAGNSTNFVITASNYYRIATLKTNGANVAGVTFDNSSTSYSYTWTNVHASGVLAATFTAQITTNPAASGANVPYSWLAEYGLTNYEADAVLDLDSDGLLTWQEYIAGTDPIDKDSCLTASQATRNKVTWIPVTGRVYSVYWSTNLTKGFVNLANNIVYPQGSYTNATPDSRVNHYQIKVRMQ